MAHRLNLLLQEDCVIVELPKLGQSYIYDPLGSWRIRARQNREFRRIFGWGFTSIVRQAWRSQRTGCKMRHQWISDWYQLGLRAKLTSP